MPPKFHRRFAPARFARARFARDLYWIILFIPVTVVFPGWMQFTVSDSATAHDHEPAPSSARARASGSEIRWRTSRGVTEVSLKM